MEENSTLFKKLRERLSWQNIVNNSAVKKVAKLTMAGVLSASILFSTGCDQINNMNNVSSNGSGIVEDNSQTDKNNSILELPSGTKVNLSEYSPVLQAVFTNDYYNNLIIRAKNQQAFGNHSCSTANKYQAIPYGFLEDEGYDVEAIKNDQIKCETEVCIINNELYIACKVENKASTPYYTHYVIKYNLTEQELKDLNLTYKEYPDGNNNARTISFQAPFFIQELSIQKDAELLSEANITKQSEMVAEDVIQTHVKTNADIDMSKFGNSVGIVYIKEEHLTEVSDRAYTQSILIYTKASRANPSIEKKTVGYLTLYGLNVKCTNIDGASVYANTNNKFPSLVDNIEEFEQTKTNATFLNSYDSVFVDMLTPKYYSFYEID